MRETTSKNSHWINYDEPTTKGIGLEENNFVCRRIVYVLYIHCNGHTQRELMLITSNMRQTNGKLNT